MPDGLRREGQCGRDRHEEAGQGGGCEFDGTGPGLVGRGGGGQLLVGDDVLDGAVRGQAEQPRHRAGAHRGEDKAPDTEQSRPPGQGHRPEDEGPQDMAGYDEPLPIRAVRDDAAGQEPDDVGDPAGGADEARGGGGAADGQSHQGHGETPQGGAQVAEQIPREPPQVVPVPPQGRDSRSAPPALDHDAHDDFSFLR